MVEMEEDICRSITAQRLSRPVTGYATRVVAAISDRREEDRNVVEGQGGGFRYCNLGESLFDERGKIGEAVMFSDLAAHVFFTETGTPIPKRATGKTPL